MSPLRNLSFDSPEKAIETLLAAYQALDIDAMVAAKDFAIDSRLFWEELGLPVTEKQKKESEGAFEANFRKEMQERIPDYRGMDYRFSACDQLQENLVVLTLEFHLPDGRKGKKKLPVFKTGSGWKAVRLGRYDHL